MTETSDVSRRAILAMLAVVGLAGPAVGQATSARGTAISLRAMLGAQRASAAHLGRAYLVMSPSEAAVDRLVDALESSIPKLATAANAGNLAVIESALAERIRHDFSNGLTAELDGWVVSLTEARLCALHALDTPGPVTWS